MSWVNVHSTIRLHPNSTAANCTFQYSEQPLSRHQLLKNAIFRTESLSICMDTFASYSV